MPDDGRASAPSCPYCGSSLVVPMSLFGQQLLTVQLYCQDCHTPFEYVKDDAVLQSFDSQARDTKGTNTHDRHQ